ncbi:sulfur carrier protein ThiS [Microbulbifer pacificus]|uniref:sulfur carrier protein ThiS n=1 Tax=Microbulbifer pacificus TaxID=407164 RepID=UPI000CF3DE11|nr:sulfur carrier protein ThiS [Microbulbifer pacificus]
MNLMVNGESLTVQQSEQTIAGVLQQLGYSGEIFAVALNGNFVARATYGETSLHDGDCLDIVAPVVGG